MPAWSLSGPILLALTAPAGGDHGTSVPRAKAPVRIVDVVLSNAYRIPPAQRPAIDTHALPTITDRTAAFRDRRFDRPTGAALQPIRDPQADCVRTLLRDRLARSGGALDARVEWRLTGSGSDVGIGGGLIRAVDALLRD